MNRRASLAAVPAAALTVQLFAADSVREITFDGGSSGEPICVVHGVNGGPLAAGWLLDLSARWKEAVFPLPRLHDSHWPNPDVVDVHAVFPAEPRRRITPQSQTAPARFVVAAITVSGQDELAPTEVDRVFRTLGVRELGKCLGRDGGVNESPQFLPMEQVNLSQNGRATDLGIGSTGGILPGNSLDPTLPTGKPCWS